MYSAIRCELAAVLGCTLARTRDEEASPGPATHPPQFQSCELVTAARSQGTGQIPQLRNTKGDPQIPHTPFAAQGSNEHVAQFIEISRHSVWRDRLPRILGLARGL